MKMLYLVRHCAAAGQTPDDALTPAGRTQAEALADRLAPFGIRRIVSSPYRRAVDTAAPLAARLGLAVETDERLVERVLCAGGHPDWREMLRASFADPDLRYEGGESGRAASDRGVAALHDVLEHPAAAEGATAIVTHGNLLALLLGRQDPAFGFDQWAAMTCPDVYRATVDAGRMVVERFGCGPAGIGAPAMTAIQMDAAEDDVPITMSVAQRFGSYLFGAFLLGGACAALALDTAYQEQEGYYWQAVRSIRLHLIGGETALLGGVTELALWVFCQPIVALFGGTVSYEVAKRWAAAGRARALRWLVVGGYMMVPVYLIGHYMWSLQYNELTRISSQLREVQSMRHQIDQERGLR